MDNQENWQRAALSSFSLNKDGPYLDNKLSVSGSQLSYQDELKKGYEEGLNKAQQECSQYKNDFETVLNSIVNSIKILDEEVVEAINKLAVSISKQIIRRELQTNSEQVVSVVKEAIKLLPLDNGRLIIHLNPSDISALKKVFNQEDMASSYSLVEDPSIQRGGCILATDNSIVDASIDSQIAQISANILGSQRNADRDDE